MSINPSDLFNFLKKKNIDFFTGVPDSLLKNFCLCINDNTSSNNHIITANEGNAIGLAAGYHLASGKLPLVYFQNSGLGNIVNPLLSLCDRDIYSIPMLLFIGWRGEPGVKDEPQHIKQGKIQIDLLRTMEIPYDIISKNDLDIENKINKGIKTAKNLKSPFAIIVKKDSFNKYNSSAKIENINKSLMSRESSLKVILENIPNNSIVVSTTGKTSREIFEIREKNFESHNKDFLTVGSMGHCSSIALGIAIAKPNRNVICIDGDGSLIMHMGSIATIGKSRLPNIHHLLLNNQVHDSVGGQKTSADIIDFSKLFKANSYKNTFYADNKSLLKSNVKMMFNKKGPNFLEVLIKPGSRNNLGRPTIKPVDNKISFMNYINNLES